MSKKSKESMRPLIWTVVAIIAAAVAVFLVTSRSEAAPAGAVDSLSIEGPGYEAFYGGSIDYLFWGDAQGYVGFATTEAPSSFGGNGGPVFGGATRDGTAMQVVVTFLDPATLAVVGTAAYGACTMKDVSYILGKTHLSFTCP